MTKQPPAKLAIGDCLGLMIQCPQCGKPAAVTHARGARTQTQVVSSAWWVLVKCTGFCGSVLRKVNEPVTVLPESMPKPPVKTLGAAVGQFVLCPRTIDLPDGGNRVCGARGQAAWTIDEGHMIACPQCGSRAWPGDTLVEVVG
jgi:DNA-directed RNA polymerase subunit RPC12/RpoP